MVLIYHFFPSLSPALIALVICPLAAWLMGMGAAWCHWRRGTLLIVFLLPLIFITSDLETFLVNLDAWLLYGLLYVGLAYVGYKLAAARVK